MRSFRDVPVFLFLVREDQTSKACTPSVVSSSLIVDKGNDFVNMEIKHLSWMLSGDLSAKKSDQFTHPQEI